MKALLLIAGVASAMQLSASSFTADEASIPASLKYLLDLRIGNLRYELYTFDLESMHDSVANNLPDASLTLTLGSNTWDLVLNEKEIRAEA